MRRWSTSYGWSDTAVDWWNVLRWPVGLALLVFAIAVLLDHAPRRRQPALSWLALGSAIAVVLSAVATVGLAAYVSFSGSFGSVYGPLAGVFALLLWALLSSDRVLLRHRRVRPARGAPGGRGRAGARRPRPPARHRVAVGDQVTG